MTTICWDGKTLAADTFAHGSVIVKVHKLYRLSDGAMFGAAGSCQEAMAVLAWLNGGEKPADLENFVGLIITRAGAQFLGERLMREPVLEPFYAIGSGAHFAIAAMACGKTAIEAVRLAERFDPYTGGPVEFMRLGKR
ncbi:MAG: hypothetical protein ACREDU_08445 [Methylocella sp.]